MTEKRKIACLIPYRIENDSIFVFMQKKAEDAPRAPGSFGFFGGGAEGDETPEENMKREVREELNISPTGYSYFKKYVSERADMDAFIMKVEDGFENTVTVSEGEYGRWFSNKEAADENKISDLDKTVVQELYEFLMK